MEKVIKIAIAVLLFICLLNMPYGYYQLVRFISMVAFGYFGFKAFEQDQQNLGVLFFGLALLFQPIFKISLGREIWNIVDVIVGV